MTHKLIFSTHNEHKLEEVRAMLKDTEFKVVSAGELNLPDVEETGETFKENALLKAFEAYRHTGIPAMADDSGLCIRGLNNEPGIYAHRYATKNGGFPAVFKVINDLLGETGDRSAYFQCTMALVFDDTEFYIFDGVLEGTIIKEPRGESGFGYDPIFVPTGFDQTLAEMGSEAKNKLSHRYKALVQVCSFLKKRG